MVSLGSNLHAAKEIRDLGSYNCFRPKADNTCEAPGGIGMPTAGLKVSRYLETVLRPGIPDFCITFVTGSGSFVGRVLVFPQPSTSDPTVLMVRNPSLGTFTVTCAVSGNLYGGAPPRTSHRSPPLVPKLTFSPFTNASSKYSPSSFQKGPFGSLSLLTLIEMNLTVTGTSCCGAGVCGVGGC